MQYQVSITSLYTVYDKDNSRWINYPTGSDYDGSLHIKKIAEIVVPTLVHGLLG